jgi:hypothetical protein
MADSLGALSRLKKGLRKYEPQPRPFLHATNSYCVYRGSSLVCGYGGVGVCGGVVYVEALEMKQFIQDLALVLLEMTAIAMIVGGIAWAVLSLISNL